MTGDREDAIGDAARGRGAQANGLSIQMAALQVLLDNWRTPV